MVELSAKQLNSAKLGSPREKRKESTLNRQNSDVKAQQAGAWPDYRNSE